MHGTRYPQADFQPDTGTAGETRSHPTETGGSGWPGLQNRPAPGRENPALPPQHRHVGEDRQGVGDQRVRVVEGIKTKGRGG